MTNIDMNEYEQTTLKNLSDKDRVTFNIAKADWEQYIFMSVKYITDNEIFYWCMNFPIDYKANMPIKTEKTEIIEFSEYFDLIDVNSDEGSNYTNEYILNNFESFYKYVNKEYLSKTKCPDNNITTNCDYFKDFVNKCINTEAVIFTYYPEHIREHNQGNQYHYAIIDTQKIVDFEQIHNKNKNDAILNNINTHLKNSGKFTLVIVTWPHLVAPDNRCVFEMKSLLVDK